MPEGGSLMRIDAGDTLFMLLNTKGVWDIKRKRPPNTVWRSH